MRAETKETFASAISGAFMFAVFLALYSIASTWPTEAMAMTLDDAKGVAMRGLWLASAAAVLFAAVWLCVIVLFPRSSDEDWDSQ